MSINIFHIFQVCGSYFLRPSEPGPGAMVVIKTLDGDTGAGARPPTPQPDCSPASLLTSRTCDDSVTQHALIFCACFSSALLMTVCVVTRARGSLARRQLQTDFPSSPVTGGGWSLPNDGQGKLCCLFPSVQMRYNLYPNYI